MYVEAKHKSPDRLSGNSVVKTLTTLGSVITIGFGIWHFIVPCIWNWYSYVDKNATELVIAVRAINIFFSMLLVLLGSANLLIVLRKLQDRFSIMVMLSISTILWATRFILQVIYPQGSQNSIIQFGMLFIFAFVFCCFLISLFFVISKK